MKRASYDDENLINLTPLIDVIFVILIIFILISPFLDIDKLTLCPSKNIKNNNMAIHSDDAMKIMVMNDDSIWINKKKIILNELTIYLQNEYIKNPKQVPKLLYDKKASFGTYHHIKTMAENAGFEEIDIILKKQ